MKKNPRGSWQEYRFGRRWRKVLMWRHEGEREKQQTHFPSFLLLLSLTPPWGPHPLSIMKTNLLPPTSLFLLMVLWFCQTAEVTVLGLSPMHFHTPHPMSCWLTWVPPVQPQVIYSTLSPSSHVLLHSNHFNQHLWNTCCQGPCLLLLIKQINQTDRVPSLLSD